MPVTPKKAVVCIVQRPNGEVLLVRRNDKLRFMGGHHVFPGGRIDAEEPVERVSGVANPEDAAAISAAAREIFEETGILCVSGELPGSDARKDSRLALLEDRTTFKEILERFDLRVPAERFDPAGAWVTPEFSPIRFDTRYFLYRHTEPQEPEVVEGEITALDWLQPAEARRLWHRGEIRVSTPVAYTLHHLAAYDYPRVLEMLRRPTARRPGLPNRFEIRRGIHIVPLTTRTIPPASTTNCILIGEEELLVIDPGSQDTNELDHLMRQIDELVDLGGTVKAIVLTHSHRDHVEGVPHLLERYGAPVWAHPETASQIDSRVDRHIQEGDILDVVGDPAWRLHALHTPGHDPGHLCFLEESTGSLLAGDMVANPGTIVVSQAFGGDMDQFLASLQRLESIDARILIPAHGQPMRNPKAVFREHREHRLWREDKIKRAVDSGAETIEDLLARAYDDVPEEALPLAEHALRAHLARLGVAIAGSS